MTNETPSDWETTVVAPFMRAVTGGGVSPARIIWDIVRRSEAFGDDARKMFKKLGDEIVERARADRASEQSFNEAIKEQLREHPEQAEMLEEIKRLGEYPQHGDPAKRLEMIKRIEEYLQHGDPVDPAKMLDIIRRVEDDYLRRRR